MRLSIHPTHPENRKIRDAVDLLRRGCSIVLPHVDRYWAACDVRHKKTFAQLQHTLRPNRKAAPEQLLLFTDLGQLARHALVDDIAFRRLRTDDPGSFRYVMRAGRDLPRHALGAGRSVKVELAPNGLAGELAQQLRSPMVLLGLRWQDQVVHDLDCLGRLYPQIEQWLDSGPIECISAPETVDLRDLK